MHYKNGTAAHEGEPVIFKRHTGQIAAGTLHTLNPANHVANALVAIPTPGGLINETVTVSEIYPAEVAFYLLESQPKPEIAS